MNHFQAWVANTILELGGNPALYLQGLQGECALTFMENRMDACQVGFDIFLQHDIQAFMRDSAVAPTNLQYLH